MTCFKSIDDLRIVPAAPTRSSTLRWIFCGSAESFRTTNVAASYSPRAAESRISFPTPEVAKWRVWKNLLTRDRVQYSYAYRRSAGWRGCRQKCRHGGQQRHTVNTSLHHDVKPIHLIRDSHHIGIVMQKRNGDALAETTCSSRISAYRVGVQYVDRVTTCPTQARTVFAERFALTRSLRCSERRPVGSRGTSLGA